MLRFSVVLLLAGTTVSCDPVGLGWAIAGITASQKKTAHFSLDNETDSFYVKADHHNYHETETYEWRNTGTTATVDGGATPSCPNHVQVRIFDAAGALMLDDTFHAPDCLTGHRRHWGPENTGTGQPGMWRIELTYDITGARDIEI